MENYLSPKGPALLFFSFALGRILIRIRLAAPRVSPSAPVTPIFPYSVPLEKRGSAFPDPFFFFFFCCLLFS